MYKILTKVLSSVVIFLIFTLPSNAIKLEENKTYSGTIKDNHRNNIPLPPGEWLLTEIKNEKLKGKGVTAGTVDYWFSNPKIGYVYYFGPTGTSASADHWVGRKTPTLCEGNPIAGKTKISGINNFEWCAWDDGNYIDFTNFTALNFEQYYHSYSIKKSLLRSTSKSTIQSIGSQIFDQVRKNKSGDLSFLSNRLDFNKSESLSVDVSNKETDLSYKLENAEVGINDFRIVCDILTCEDSGGDFSFHLKNFLEEGNKYEFPYLAVETNRIGADIGPAWGMDTGINYSIDVCEEYSRGPCSLVISNGKIRSKKFYNLFIAKKGTNKTKENLVTSNSSTKDKLKELKSLLEDGLISQDQYDKKSDEILKAF